MTRPWKQARWTGFVILGLLLMLAGRGEWAGPARAADGNNEKSPAPPPTPAYSADEETIRAAVEAFVQAFNAGDAKAVVADWTADGQYTDEDGNVFRGRDAIEKEYARLFAAHPGATIAVSIESLRFQGAETAVEKGIARVTPAGGSTPTAARYTLVHVKRAGKWLLAVGRDAPYAAAASEDRLKDLEWLIGQWRLDSKTESRQIKFAWIGEKNFIKNTYRSGQREKTPLSGEQIIGWNPKLGRIVSWHFDAQGSFGNDQWTKDESKWVIEASGVFADGSECSAVNIITPLDADSFTWQSTNRTLDGVRMPDVGPIKIVRVQPGK